MKNRQGLIVGFYLSKHQKIHRTTIMLGSFWTVGCIRKCLLTDAKRRAASTNRADSDPDGSYQRRYHHDPHPLGFSSRSGSHVTKSSRGVTGWRQYRMAKLSYGSTHDPWRTRDYEHPDTAVACLRRNPGYTYAV